MNAKKIAILIISASLTMGTVGTMTVLADPPAIGSEVPQMPNIEQQLPNETSLNPDRNLMRFTNWHQNLIMKKKPEMRPSDKHRKRFGKKSKKKY